MLPRSKALSAYCNELNARVKHSFNELQHGCKAGKVASERRAPQSKRGPVGNLQQPSEPCGGDFSHQPDWKTPSGLHGKLHSDWQVLGRASSGVLLGQTKENLL